MTILIAVLSEAYTNRYKSALQKGSFQKAMKHLEAHQAEHDNGNAEDEPHHEDDELPSDEPPAVTPLEIAQRMRTSAYHVDAVPSAIKDAKAFHECLKYVDDRAFQERGPAEIVTKLLEETATSEKMDNELKQEMLNNDDARKALFYVSHERKLWILFRFFLCMSHFRGDRSFPKAGRGS